MARELFWVSRTPRELNVSVQGILNGGPLFVGEVGLPIVVQFTDSSGIPIDLSNSTGREILLRRPGGTSGALLTCSGQLYTNGLDGKMKYVTVSGDFNVLGNYEAQGFAIPQSGQARYSERLAFNVQDNLRSG